MTSSDPHYAVVQIGARRNYAVPALLQNAGMLEHFYTDVCSSVGIGRFLSACKALPVVGPKLGRLARRELPPGVDRRSTTFTLPLLSHMLRGPLARDEGEAYRENVRWTDSLGRAIARRGFGAATHLYSMLGECAPALEAGRRRGLRVVTEMYILLSADRIVGEERRRFPDWEPESPDYDVVRRELRTEFAMLENTDLAVCPAPSVSEDLVANYGFSAEKTAVVPYGVDPEWLDLKNSPVPGRILFAGSAGLRKGIHYLAMAAEILSRGGVRYEFRVAGDVPPRIAAQPVCRHLTFLGRVPRHAIQSEFESADLLALPTLAEGSAEVTYQALAAGVPVVTTPESGSVVRDDIEGRIVPGRNPERLAEAIAAIVENRSLRERYSNAARLRGAEFVWDRYGERLLRVLRSA